MRAVPGDDGQWLALVVCEDITQRKRADKQLAKYQQQLKALSIEMALAEERERHRIANGLHDDVGHRLAIAKLKAAMLRTAPLPREVIETLSDICNHLDDAIEETRALTFELSSPVLYEVGLDAALQSLGELLSEGNDFQFYFDNDRPGKRLAEEKEIVVYRIVQELLVNVVKHAHAQNVSLSIKRVDDHIQLMLEDDGVGFRACEASIAPGPHGGFGLFSIRERLDQIGGYFDILSVANS